MPRSPLRYQPDPPPITGDQNVIRWAYEQFSRIAIAQELIWNMPPLGKEPVKRVEGLLVFADGVGWNPGSGKGPYVYQDGGWVKL